MIKKIVSTCVATLILGSMMSTGMANDLDAAPIHWGSNPINNANGEFKNGKSFCSKKYIGRKTCIPAMNNTSDVLTVLTTAYASDTAPNGTVVTLMGKDSLDSVVFTVQDIDAHGQATTVYSGPANDKEGIVCNEDQNSKAITCSAWK